METEKVPMAIIYKKNGYINIEYSDDGNKGFEIFGFLKCLVNKMEIDLENSMSNIHE